MFHWNNYDTCDQFANQSQGATIFLNHILCSFQCSSSYNWTYKSTETNNLKHISKSQVELLLNFVMKSDIIIGYVDSKFKKETFYVAKKCMDQERHSNSGILF